MSSPLVSIIVPVYKVEPYLKRCLNSIVSQTYANLEVILVDDGSPDNCPKICDEYAVSDKRITVIHKKNGGLSDARNTGLNICNGEYISFVDSDDWVSNDYIETLLLLAIKEHADIAIGENIQTKGAGEILLNNAQEQLYSSKDALYHLFSKKHIAFTISCGKLYKRELFSNLRFPIGKYHEDEFTTYILFYQSEKIIYTSKTLYYYYRHSNSITDSRHPWDILEFLEQRYLFFKEKNEQDLLPFLLVPLCWQLLCAYWFLHKDHDISSNHYLNQLNYYIKDFTCIKKPLFHYIPLALFAKMPQLYLLYRKFSPFYIRKDF